MAKKTIATMQLNNSNPTKKTKIIRIIKYKNSKKFSFEEKFIDSNLVKDYFDKKSN